MRTPAIAALLLITIGLTTAAQAMPQTIAMMRDHRRVILISEPRPNDPQAAAQLAILSGWKKEAADRDISVVTVTGARVSGSADKVAVLRSRYRLVPDQFQVLLIGKDGHVAMRSTRPIVADQFQSAIDAMPMRKAGQR